MKTVEVKKEVVIRFAGDSGDGMQVVGTQFTNTSAIMGNDVHTYPDYPAEIRAPSGTLAGVSGFQIRFGENPVHTSGDHIDVLVAMNPAALQVNRGELKVGSIIIINEDAFTEASLRKAGYEQDPRFTDELRPFQIIALPITTQTLQALTDCQLKHSSATKCKNFFALGVVFWLYDRPLEHCLRWLETKFHHDAEILKANTLALKSGYLYAEQTELVDTQYQVPKAQLPPGLYRQITGNEALCLGFAAASYQQQRALFVSGYPITPASVILHTMARLKDSGITLFQAEDEIAAICAAIGAAYGGLLACCCTSGPGIDLKSEGLGLAVMAEIPLVLVDVQRAGPSTGLPTKGEQSDLLAAIYGRHGECPLPVFAPATPAECFTMALFAMHIATKYMLPVFILSDAFLANGAEPWCIPSCEAISQQAVINAMPPAAARQPDTGARAWVTPGMADEMFTIGGLEKDQTTGNVSYDPINHQQMVALRAHKLTLIQAEYPDLEIHGAAHAELLVLSWGSTYGSVLTAVENCQAASWSVSLVHLRHLHPLPQQLAQILPNFKKIVIPELNAGQLAWLIRANFQREVISFSKVQGKPFSSQELEAKIISIIEAKV